MPFFCFSLANKFRVWPWNDRKWFIWFDKLGTVWQIFFLFSFATSVNRFCECLSLAVCQLVSYLIQFTSAPLATFFRALKVILLRKIQWNSTTSQQRKWSTQKQHLNYECVNKSRQIVVTTILKCKSRYSETEKWEWCWPRFKLEFCVSFEQYPAWKCSFQRVEYPLKDEINLNVSMLVWRTIVQTIVIIKLMTTKKKQTTHTFQHQISNTKRTQ